MRSKRPTLLTVVACLVLGLLLTARRSAAITFGERDGDAHPYVGLLVVEDVSGDFFICSGTLIAPTVFLTAAHCVVSTVGAWVSFEEVPPIETFPDGFVSGTGIPHPAFSDFALPNTNDIGVVVLDTPVPMAQFGRLAELGFLDQFATRRGQQRIRFEPVGYGLQGVRPRVADEIVRYRAEQQLINLRSAATDGFNIQLTNNPGRGNGRGGTCSGDSGGPILVAGTNVVVAVNSFGIAALCKGNDFAYRVDIQNSLDFLAGFVSLP